ncbi:MAG: hypothetical protein ACRCVG_04565 [Methanobacteriaceae archaeon]
MKIVTSPMCEKIVRFAGITNYIVNKNPDNEDGDLAIILSENKTKMPCLNLKLNTFAQIRNSIFEVSKYSKYSNVSGKDIGKIFSNYPVASDFINKVKDNNYINYNSKINVLVISKFLSEIINDMGFNIVNTISTIEMDSNDLNILINNVISNYNFDFLVYPDYMDSYINIGYANNDVSNDNTDNNNNCNSCFKSFNNSINDFAVIKVPSHKNVSLDPIKRAESRYSLIENGLLK